MIPRPQLEIRSKAKPASTTLAAQLQACPKATQVVQIRANWRQKSAATPTTDHWQERHKHLVRIHVVSRRGMYRPGSGHNPSRLGQTRMANMMQLSGQAVEMMDEWRTGPDADLATLWTGETWFLKAEDDEPDGNRSSEVLDQQLQCFPGIAKDHWTVKSTETSSGLRFISSQGRALHPSEDVDVKLAPNPANLDARAGDLLYR